MAIAELSQSDIMGARFREGIRRAGGLVVGDPEEDQAILERAGVHLDAKRQDDRPGYIEIDAADGERVIVITQRDGTRVELHPLLTYGNQKKMPFYQRQLEQLQTELDACDDEARYMEILVRASALEEKLLQLAIPDLPAGLLDRLETGVLNRIREAGERMRQQGKSAPNG